MDMKYSNLYRSCATKMTSTLVNGSFEMPQIPLTVLLLAGVKIFMKLYFIFLYRKIFNFQPQLCECTKIWNCMYLNLGNNQNIDREKYKCKFKKSLTPFFASLVERTCLMC